MNDKALKVLQFGEGNFLRCFIDWMVQRMNDSAGFDGLVQIVQPIGDELSPPSKIRGILPSKSSKTCCAEVGLTCLERLALGATMGISTARKNACAPSCEGIRTANVFKPQETYGLTLSVEG